MSNNVRKIQRASLSPIMQEHTLITEAAHVISEDYNLPVHIAMNIMAEALKVAKLFTKQHISPHYQSPQLSGLFFYLNFAPCIPTKTLYTKTSTKSKTYRYNVPSVFLIPPQTIPINNSHFPISTHRIRPFLDQFLQKIGFFKNILNLGNYFLALESLTFKLRIIYSILIKTLITFQPKLSSISPEIISNVDVPLPKMPRCRERD